MADEKIILAEIDIETDKATAEIIKLRDQISKLSSEQKELTEAGKKNTAEYVNNEAAIKALNKEVGQYQTILIKSTQIQKNKSGSIAEMSAQLSAVTVQWNKLSEADRLNSEEGNKLTAQKTQLTEALSKERQSTGDARMEVGKYEKAGASLRSELKTIIAEMQKMHKAGMENSEEFKNLSVKAGKLKDSMDAVNDQVRTLTVGSKLESSLNAMAGGFDAVIGTAQTAYGVMALFGNENKEVEKSIQKMVALQSIASGVQSTFNALKKEGALVTSLYSAKTKALAAAKLIYATAIGTATGKLKLFRIALLSTGIGAIIVGIGLLIANWDKLSSMFSKSAKEAEKLNKQMDDQRKSFEELNKSSDHQLKVKKALGASESELIQQEIKNYNERINQNKKIMEWLDKLRELGKLSDEQKQERDELYFKNQDIRRDIQLKNIELEKSINKEEQELIEKNKKAQEEQDKNNKKIKEDKDRRNKEELENKRKMAEDSIALMQLEFEIYKEKNKEKISSLKEYENISVEMLKEEIKRIEDADSKEWLILKSKLDNKLITEKEFQLDELKLYSETEEQKSSIQKTYSDQQEENRKAAAAMNAENEKIITEQTITARYDLERDLLTAKYEEDKLLAEKYGADIVALDAAYAAQKKTIAEAEFNAKLDLASGFTKNLATIFGEQTMLGKVAAIASTTIETYKAAQGAFASQMIPGDPSSVIRGYVAAGAAVAAGIANVKKIMAVNPKGGNSTPSGSSGGGGSVGGGNRTISSTVGGGMIMRDIGDQTEVIANGMSKALKDNPQRTAVVIDDVTAKQSDDMNRNRAAAI